MPISKAQQKAVSKYMKEHYDEIKLRIEKGRKEEIKAHAKVYGESVNSFIGRAIKETMERDWSINKLNVTAAPPTEASSIKQQTAKPEQTAASLTEQEPSKSFIEDVENKVNLIKLLADVNYQLDIEETYGFETLRALLDKARQQEREMEKAAIES